MGNIHTIIQVAPVVHLEGAAIQVKEPYREKVKEFYRKNSNRNYTELHERHISFPINNPNVGPSIFHSPVQLLYLVIKSGGKRGYDDGLFNLLNELAPFLEEAIFYIDDEYDGYVEEWAINNGSCRRVKVKASGANVFSYIEEKHKKDRDIQFELYYQKATDHFSTARKWLHLPNGKDIYHEEVEHARAFLTAALAIRPSHINALQLSGDIFSKNGQYDEAIAVFENALEIFRQGIEIEKWGDRKELSTVLDDWGGLQTNTLKELLHKFSYALIESGKYERAIKYLDEWSGITPKGDDQTPDFLLAYCLHRLGKQEEAQQLYKQVIRESSNRKLIANAFFNRACLFALNGKSEEAIKALQASINMDDRYIDMARDDRDFAGMLQTPGFIELVTRQV